MAGTTLPLSKANIAMCVCIVVRHHSNYDNSRGWVVMMWSRDLFLVVIGVAIVLTYN